MQDTSLKISDEAKAAADKAKASGFDVQYTRIVGKEFIFRPVTRQEWKILLKKRNEELSKAGDNEVLKAEVMEEEFEELLKVCLVFSVIEVPNLPAGTVQALCDSILAFSGFGGLDMEPVKL